MTRKIAMLGLAFSTVVGGFALSSAPASAGGYGYHYGGYSYGYHKPRHHYGYFQHRYRYGY